MLGNQWATYCPVGLRPRLITVTSVPVLVLPLARSPPVEPLEVYCRSSFIKKLLESEPRDSALESGQSVSALIQNSKPIIEANLPAALRQQPNPGINGFSAPSLTTGHIVCSGHVAR